MSTFRTVFFAVILLGPSDSIFALSKSSQKIVDRYKNICDISSRVIGEKTSPMLKRPMMVEYDFKSTQRGRNIIWKPDLPGVAGIEVKDGKLALSGNATQPAAMQDMVRGIAELIAAVSTANMEELSKTMDIAESENSWELVPKIGKSNMGRLKKLTVSFDDGAAIGSMKIEVGEDVTLLKFTKLLLSDCSGVTEGRKP